MPYHRDVPSTVATKAGPMTPVPKNESHLRTASGEPASNERNDEHQIALWKTGVKL
jgi:hypothetical protein